MADVSRLPGPNADIWDWQLIGLCRGEDPNVFFHPEVSKKTKIATLKYGKSFSIQLDDLDSISQKLLLKNPKLILK